MPSVSNEVRTHLDGRTDFEPSLRMFWARQTQDTAWTATAFRQLVALPMKKLHGGDFERLGGEVAYLICRTQERIRRQRVLIAMTAPPFEHVTFGCAGPGFCDANFAQVWWNKVGQKLINFSPYMRGIDVAKDLVHGNWTVLGANSLCWEQTARRQLELASAKRGLGKEDAIVDVAVTRAIRVVCGSSGEQAESEGSESDDED
jgi:hypothetical protein